MRAGNIDTKVAPLLGLTKDPGSQEFDDRLDPARKRPRQDSRNGEAHPQQIRIPAGLAGRGGEDGADAGGVAVPGLGAGVTNTRIGHDKSRALNKTGPHVSCT